MPSADLARIPLANTRAADLASPVPGQRPMVVLRVWYELDALFLNDLQSTL